MMIAFIHSGPWQLIKKKLKHDRADYLERLVRNDDEQIRGRIKMIDDILERYPDELSAKDDD